MPRIAEKLEFMTGCAVKVYAKAWIGRKAGHKKPCFTVMFSVIQTLELWEQVLIDESAQGFHETRIAIPEPPPVETSHSGHGLRP